MTYHRMKNTSEYNSWQAMKRRCLDPKNKAFKYYGAKGIRVCAEWESDFLKFFEDMGKKPSSNHSLDRINTEGDYCKDNCRWATHTEQMRNRTNTVRCEFNGKKMTRVEIENISGISHKLIEQRMRYYKISAEQAVALGPSKNSKSRIKRKLIA